MFFLAQGSKPYETFRIIQTYKVETSTLKIELSNYPDPLVCSINFNSKEGLWILQARGPFAALAAGGFHRVRPATRKYFLWDIDRYSMISEWCNYQVITRFSWFFSVGTWDRRWCQVRGVRGTTPQLWDGAGGSQALRFWQWIFGSKFPRSCHAPVGRNDGRNDGIWLTPFYCLIFFGRHIGEEEVAGLNEDLDGSQMSFPSGAPFIGEVPARHVWGG